MTQSLADYVAGQLRAEMARRQIPASQLARDLGEEETWVRRRMKGERGISLSDLERIAVALGMSLEYFLPLSERAA